MNIKTHKMADALLLGTPVIVDEGVRAVVRLEAVERMVVDDHGLVHGGFTFGIADYAAMLSVNEPFVVLGSSSVKFTAPVKVGDVMFAEALVTGSEGRRREVSVEVKVGETVVLNGMMQCYVLQHHVMQK
jgi:acyl-coenzyme A thioesterase PaaI-like protein